MRVLQLIDSLDAGGAERMAVNLANELSDRIAYSGLCVTRKEGLLINSIGKNVRYHFLDKKRTIDIRASRRLLRIIDSNGINLIHAHSSSFFVAWIISFLRPGVRLIWHDHYGKSEFLNRRKSMVLKLASLRFQAIISVNEDLKDWAVKNLKCKHVYFIPNFITTSVDSESITELKGEQGKRVICLANLRSQKDHLNLLSAFHQIHQQYGDWTLHLVGKDFNDEYSDLIRSRINDLELSEVVFLYGSCPDTSQILNQCDIGVLSSESEGLPLALLEYGKHGLATIATDVGLCKWVLQDSGLIVPPKNPTNLCAAIEVYIKDDVKRLENGQNFMNFINKKFSGEAAMKSIIDVYQKSLS